MRTCEYEHILVDNVYLRKVNAKAGTVMLGAVHRKETALVVLKGALRIVYDKTIKVLKAGEILISKPGTQRAILFLENSEAFTIHSVISTTLPEIEAELTDCTVVSCNGKFKTYQLGVLHESLQLSGGDPANFPGPQHFLSNRAASIEGRHPVLHDAAV